MRGSMWRHAGTLLAGCISLLFLVSPAFAGSDGAIEGWVVDPTGARVLGAQLDIRNIHTALTLRAMTNASGLFEFPVVPLGSYELTVTHPGFAPLIVKSISVTVGARVNLALALDVATPAEEIVVTSGTPVLESTRSQVCETVDEREVSSLPVNGRNFIDFTLLLPGVTQDVRTGLVSFAGQRSMNSLLVDGSDTNQTFFGLPMGGGGKSKSPYQFSLATVEEFQVNSNAYSAELGRAGAGVINVVTKSGSNDFRGNAFWYYRDKSMKANDLVSKINGQPKSPYHFHQFGAVLGGPVIRDRLFFLGDYEGQRSSIQNNVFLRLPSSFTVTTPFEQQAWTYLVARSAPWQRTFDQDVFLGRLDWQLNPSQQFHVRWNSQRFTGLGQENFGPQNSFEHSGTSIVNTDALSVALTSTISSSRVNQSRFGYVSSHEPGSAYSPDPEADVFQNGQLLLTIGRNPISPRHDNIDRLEGSDSLSLVRGHQLLKLGADTVWDQVEFFTASNFSGSYRFLSLESFGESLAGMPQPRQNESYRQAFSGVGTPGATQHPNFTEWTGFIEDEWRILPQLSFNLGARYDLQLIAKPSVKNPSPALAAAGLDTSFVPTDTNNLAPRFGFAWMPVPSHGRVMLRGGYGIFYGMTPSIMTARAFFQNGITVQTDTLSANLPAQAALIPAYPNTLCGPPNPSAIAPNCRVLAATGNPTPVFFSPHYAQPYTQQGSFGLEVEADPKTTVSLLYLWVKGSHLQRTQDVNLNMTTKPQTIGIAGASPLLSYRRFSGKRPIPGFDRIWLFESAASSTYNGLDLQVNRRFEHNFELRASYTLGKVMDDVPDHFTVNPGVDDFDQLSDESDPRADRGPGANDQRHRLVVSGIWDLNYGERFPRPLQPLFRGWELSGIFAAQSGHPYSGLLNYDLNNDGNFQTDRTPGLGRDTFVLPPTVSFDPRIARTLSLTERIQMQFIWEAFNVLNHPNITGVKTTQYSVFSTGCGNSGTPCLVPQNTGPDAFGVPTDTSGPRIMQLSVKLGF